MIGDRPEHRAVVVGHGDSGWPRGGGPLDGVAPVGMAVAYGQSVHPVAADPGHDVIGEAPDRGTVQATADGGVEARISGFLDDDFTPDGRDVGLLHLLINLDNFTNLCYKFY